MSKITHNWEETDSENILVLEKKRGKITIEEIENYLKYEIRGIENRKFCIVFDLNESSSMPQGFWEEITQPSNVKLQEIITMNREQIGA